jgi:hypothetical protein
VALGRTALAQGGPRMGWSSRLHALEARSRAVSARLVPASCRPTCVFSRGWYVLLIGRRSREIRIVVWELADLSTSVCMRGGGNNAVVFRFLAHEMNRAVGQEAVQASHVFTGYCCELLFLSLHL